MKKNTLSLIIERPVDEVFAYTTDPNNTPKWYDDIKEEKVDTSPIGLHTQYSNRGYSDDTWSTLTVVEYHQDKTFTLKDNNSTYHVQYVYESIDDTKTRLTYTEWVENGELSNPFDQLSFNRLKGILESL